jgi:hypothetical protein
MGKSGRGRKGGGRRREGGGRGGRRRERRREGGGRGREGRKGRRGRKRRKEEEEEGGREGQGKAHTPIFFQIISQIQNPLQAQIIFVANIIFRYKLVCLQKKMRTGLNRKFVERFSPHPEKKVP